MAWDDTQTANDSITHTEWNTMVSYIQGCDNVFSVCSVAGTGDYATIQAALDANTSGGELFLVYPGTYTDDTIAFTANNQVVKGMANTPSAVHVTTANANIVDYGAFTGCKMSEVKATVTAASSAINTVTGTGSCNLYRCHIGMTTAYSAVGTQPACYGGTGSVKIRSGTIDYDHTGNTTNAIKAGILLGDGCSYDVVDAVIDIDCSGTAGGTTMVWGTGASSVSFNRCDGDINDTDCTYAVGIYPGGTGALEFIYNTLHIYGGGAGKIATGVRVTGTPTVRAMFNYIHVEAVTGGTAYAYGTTAASTITSQFEDIIAADGNNLNVATTFTHCYSESDGDFDVSGEISGSTGSFSSTVTVGDYVLPSADGNANDVLKTDGSGTLSWQVDNNTTYDGEPTIDVTSGLISVVTAQVDHDTLKNYVANDHIDWTSDQGATNIDAGNYNSGSVDSAGNYTWTGTHQFDSTATFNSAVSCTSSVTVNGLTVDVNTCTGAYTATTVDDVLFCNGTFTLTLPSASACVGKIFRVKNIGTGTVTIATNGGTIDGSATVVLYNRYESINPCSDASNYFII